MMMVIMAKIIMLRMAKMGMMVIMMLRMISSYIAMSSYIGLGLGSYFDDAKDFSFPWLTN